MKKIPSWLYRWMLHPHLITAALTTAHRLLVRFTHQQQHCPDLLEAILLPCRHLSKVFHNAVLDVTTATFSSCTNSSVSWTCVAFNAVRLPQTLMMHSMRWKHLLHQGQSLVHKQQQCVTDDIIQVNTHSWTSV